MVRQKPRGAGGAVRPRPLQACQGKAGRPARHALAAAGVRGAKKTSSAKDAPARAAASKQNSAAEPDVRAQLAAAQARIKDLEARLAAVTDRIAWIADRLHSLLENGK